MNKKFYESKKFWAMVIGVISVVLSHVFNIPEDVTYSIAGIVISLIIGQSVIDFKGNTNEVNFDKGINVFKNMMDTYLPLVLNGGKDPFEGATIRQKENGELYMDLEQDKKERCTECNPNLNKDKKENNPAFDFDSIGKMIANFAGLTPDQINSKHGELLIEGLKEILKGFEGLVTKDNKEEK